MMLLSPLQLCGSSVLLVFIGIFIVVECGEEGGGGVCALLFYFVFGVSLSLLRGKVGSGV